MATLLDGALDRRSLYSKRDIRYHDEVSQIAVFKGTSHHYSAEQASKIVLVCLDGIFSYPRPPIRRYNCHKLACKARLPISYLSRAATQ